MASAPSSGTQHTRWLPQAGCNSSSNNTPPHPHSPTHPLFLPLQMSFWVASLFGGNPYQQQALLEVGGRVGWQPAGLR